MVRVMSPDLWMEDKFLGNSDGGNYGTTRAGNEWIEIHHEAVDRLRAVR
jgi:hypothetical protein